MNADFQEKTSIYGPEQFVSHLTTKKTLLRRRNSKITGQNKKQHLLKKGASFKEFIHSNLKSNGSTVVEDIRSAVDSFNHNQLHSLAQDEKKQLKTKQNLSIPHQLYQSYINDSFFESHGIPDIFSQSLIYTNMLFNRYYGFKPRRILAHVGFLLDRTIIEDMQRKFPKETEETARHRFRTGNDLQFALAYYSFVMEETRRLSIKEIFKEFDTDNSQTWSDREIRTLLARLFPLPLSLSALRFLEDVINNCSRSLDEPRSTSFYTTLIYERYMDSNLVSL